MSVIRKLTDRVEKEHNQLLRDTQRIEDRSATAVNGNSSATAGATIDFESLVGKANGASVRADTVLDTSSAAWEDDVWGSLLTSPAEVMRSILTVYEAAHTKFTDAEITSADSPTTAVVNPYTSTVSALLTEVSDISCDFLKAYGKSNFFTWSGCHTDTIYLIQHECFGRAS